MDPITFPVVLSIFSIILVANVLFKFILPWGYGAKPLPPGKMGLPFLGESIEFILSMLKGQPEMFVHKRRRLYSSDTFKTSIVGDPVTVMHSTAGTKFLFSNEGKLVKAWWPKPVHRLIPSSNAETFRVRDIAHSLLKVDGLKKYVVTMDRLTKLHVKATWLGRQQVTVHRLAENHTFSLACHVFMSIDDPETIESLATVLATVSKGLFSFPIDLPWTQFGRAMQASRLAMKLLKDIIRQRRVELQQLSLDDSTTYKDGRKISFTDVEDDRDMLSLLLLATNELGEHMNDEEIADRLTGFLVAGNDTSGAVIALLFCVLADNPDIYDKVLQEQLQVEASKGAGEFLNWEDINKMRYSWDVAREVMRLYPPAFVIHREAMDDLQYDGYCIPKGWKIQKNIVSTHRDPNFFPNPEKFDPSRFEGAGPLPYTYIPFGGGPRMCPGRNYTKFVILVFLHNIITKFRWEKVHANEAISYNPYANPLHGLPVRLQPHPVLKANM